MRKIESSKRTAVRIDRFGGDFFSVPTIDYNPVISLLLGMVSNAKINKLEVNQLVGWTIAHGIHAHDWPAGIIAARLNRLYEAGAISDDDTEDLILLLHDLIGPVVSLDESPSKIPYTEPVPKIHFLGKQFVFVGHFVHGVAACVDDIWLRGGRSTSSVGNDTDYIVVGSIRSQEWEKNEKWSETQAAGEVRTVTVVSEQTFLKALQETQLPAHSWRIV